MSTTNELLRKWLEKFGDAWDAGPPREGWQSDELLALIEQTREILATSRIRSCLLAEATAGEVDDVAALNATLHEAAGEIDRLRRKLEEAQEANEALRAKALEWLNAYKAESEVAKEARRKAFEEAAEIAYQTCAETRHVKLGDACAAAIRQRAEEEAR